MSTYVPKSFGTACPIKVVQMQRAGLLLRHKHNHNDIRKRSYHFTVNSTLSTSPVQRYLPTIKYLPAFVCRYAYVASVNQAKQSGLRSCNRLTIHGVPR